MTTTTSPNRGASSLAGFRATQAEALALQVAGPAGVDTVQVITYSGDEFTLSFRVVGAGGIAPDIVRVLGDQELQALLDSLQDELDHPPAGMTLDLAALRVFVEVLHGKVGSAASNRFEHVRFAGIGRDAGDAIVAYLGIGVDVVGTLQDSGGTVTFEQHVLPRAPGPFQPLSQADLDSLAAALNAYLRSASSPDPMWRQLFSDLTS